MLVPAVIFVLIYGYGPMIGIIIAFEKFSPAKGILHSKWIGFENFNYILHMPDIYQVLWNTLYIAVMKIVIGLIVPILISLMLNEIQSQLFKRGIQTAIYLPYFFSWVIMGGIVIDILSPSNGIVNQLLNLVGIKSIFFLGDYHLFPYTLVVTDVWKNFGFNTIIFLAALTNINQTLYEAAVVDGANRWKQTLHITLPGIMPIIILMFTLSLGNVLNAGFDQVFNLYSPQVYRSGDIIDTLVYRLGLVDGQFGPATAVGLFKSVVSLILIYTSYKLAEKYANYRIF